MKLGMELSLGPGHIVLHWDPAPPSPKGHSRSPQFSAHVCCGQTAGWIKMPLGMKVGLGPGDIVLDREPSLPQKGGTAAPTFRPMNCGQTAGWIKMPLGIIRPHRSTTYVYAAYNVTDRVAWSVGLSVARSVCM